MKRYIKVIEPMNTFSLITKTLHSSMDNLEFNNLLDFEAQLWPKLLKDVKTFDSEENSESIDLL
jgi:hypothetical protein